MVVFIIRVLIVLCVLSVDSFCSFRCLGDVQAYLGSTTHVPHAHTFAIVSCGSHTQYGAASFMLKCLPSFTLVPRLSFLLCLLTIHSEVVTSP